MSDTKFEDSVGVPAISVERVRKAYGATIAVDDASFSIARGAVHALLGENGAGKSTIVKLLSGLTQPDSGGLRLFGAPVRFASPRNSQARGIQTAFQEMTLVNDLTVLDNMLLPRGPSGLTGMIRRRQARALVAAHFDALGMSDVRLDDEIGELDLAIQQKIEIARALFRKPRILLLDEPTSTLSGRDVEWLGGIIERLRAEGVTTVFISHRLREVRAFCDTMTVLRNGMHIATGPVASYPDDEVIRMIAGRALSHAFPRGVKTSACSDPRCSPPNASRPPASSATPRSACIRAKSWAWPASRAWVSSICFSPVSAWPI